MSLQNSLYFLVISAPIIRTYKNSHERTKSFTEYQYLSKTFNFFNVIKSKHKYDSRTMKLSPCIAQNPKMKSPLSSPHSPSKNSSIKLLHRLSGKAGRYVGHEAPTDRKGKQACSWERSYVAPLLKTLRGGLASRYCPPLFLAVPSYPFPPRKLSLIPHDLSPPTYTRARAHAHIHIYLSLRPLAAAQNPTRSTAAEHTLSRSCSWQCDLVGSWTDPLMRDRRLTSWTTDTILVLTCTHDQNTVNWLKSKRELIITHRVKGW